MKHIFKFFKWYANWWRDYYATKCPKCNGKKVKDIKETAGNAFKRNTMTVLIPIRLLWIKKPATLHVCQECGFEWEDRK